ncbi:uncharacterized protein ACNLHF_026226 isoform 2-T4 [Anomaloglossus baeobatrachus]|uniref:uncharacterized protein LOC142245371 isoform X4 n=1 Tax=Anomaloglossus baeobatrachus TaxID=238106 RepID=UPI003F4F5DC3
MAKSDIESAFRLLPVHPDCHHLLGCVVDGAYYYNTCLPMGCAISCRHFELFSSFLEWVIKDDSGSKLVTHYLEDFLFVGPAGSDRCSNVLMRFKELMGVFGVPLSEEKTVGPLSCLSFLGIEIDTMDMVFRLPVEKIDKLLGLIDGFHSLKKVTLAQMQSLLGSLAFACRIMPMGRIFSRRLAMAMRGVQLSHHRIRIGLPLRADLQVWRNFLLQYNGRTCFQGEERSCQDLPLFADAAGSVGFGVIFRDQWCAERWPSRWIECEWTKNLTLLKLFTLVVAVVIWGEELANSRVCFWSDNESVVHAVNHLLSSSLPVVKLIRFLVLRCLSLNIWVRAWHVPGIKNSMADALSRFDFQKFRELAPLVSQQGATCPDYLWEVPEAP